MRQDPAVGGDILRLLTAGMYDNPLVVYREYIQNAADAVTANGSPPEEVLVNIDPTSSQVTITDYGTGLSPSDAARRLIQVGNSTKDPNVDRGFRGIGRLSALAFADQVDFTTRTSGNDPVTQVTWDGRTLRNLDLSFVDADAAIEACTSVRTLPEREWPHRFFQVDIRGVSRHAASTLLNVDKVRRYISEVCPVPLAIDFPLADRITDLLTPHRADFALHIRVNDDESPIQRPFGSSIPLSEEFHAPFDRLETRTIPALDRDDPAAVLWLAHSTYTGSIPSRLSIRGLRARVGNIQIGTEQLFERHFLEPRFNGWCVGEVHIVDARIAPNGRRDYFEPGPHLRNIENHIGAIAQEISSRCRRASSQRNKLRAVGAAIRRLERAHDLAASGYLHPNDAAALIAREQERIPAIRQTLTQVDPYATSSHLARLTNQERQLGTFTGHLDTPMLSHKAVANSDTYRTVFGAIAKNAPPDEALTMITAIMDDIAHEHR